MGSRRRRVLVVDDNPLLLRIAALSLRRAGFEVFTASDGHAAREWLQEAPQLDLLVTDMQMPRLDGRELCAELRRMPQHARTPVVMLTAGPADGDAEGLQHEGSAIRWLSKPYSPLALVSEIEALLAAEAPSG